MKEESNLLFADVAQVPLKKLLNDIKSDLRNNVLLEADWSGDIASQVVFLLRVQEGASASIHTFSFSTHLSSILLESAG